MSKDNHKKELEIGSLLVQTDMKWYINMWAATLMWPLYKSTCPRLLIPVINILFTEKKYFFALEWENS